MKGMNVSRLIIFFSLTSLVTFVLCCVVLFIGARCSRCSRCRMYTDEGRLTVLHRVAINIIHISSTRNTHKYYSTCCVTPARCRSFILLKICINLSKIYQRARRLYWPAGFAFQILATTKQYLKAATRVP